MAIGPCHHGEIGDRTLTAMTPDEVVASRLRELVKNDRDLSTKVLAQKLGIGEDQARDMQRPRRGRAQRAFTWLELVQLCEALDMSLFELVLPPEDVTVIGYKGEVPPDARGIRKTILTSMLTAGRDQFARDVFQLPGGDWTPEFLSGVIDIIDDERTTRGAELEADVEKFTASARDFQAVVDSFERQMVNAVRRHRAALQEEE